MSESRRTVCAAIFALSALAVHTAAASAGEAQTDWPNYNNSYDGRRFSALRQINAKNVAALKRVCSINLGDPGPFQTGPIVIDGTMYVTTSHTVVALDAARCSVKWRFVYTPEEEEAWPVNRGAAYADGRVFRGTGDARFLALDAKTGHLLWKVKVGHPETGEAISAAPLAWKGRVYIGIAVSDLGIRGRILALDASTGKEVWRFNTIPVGHEVGADTWPSQAAASIGGGGTWSSYALDEKRAELLIPVGNPHPMFKYTERSGANLFTNSVVALDGRTGALKWWYQLTPADWHDWDVAAAPALFPGHDGKDIVVAGSKDGHVYGIDRATRQLRFKTAVTTLKNIDVPFDAQDVFVCPGILGGVEWNGPAVDAARHRIYVGSVDWCATYSLKEFAQADIAQGWIFALDANTGQVKWRYHSQTPIVAGVTPTAGGVVFTGDLAGRLLALDSSTGEVLKTIETGGSIAGGVVTYAMAGRQYVGTTSGNISKIAFEASTGNPKIMIFALKGESFPEVDAERTAAEGGNPPTKGKRGPALYAAYCSGCHGMHGEGSTGPPITGVQKRMSLDDIIRQIKTPRAVMPKLYPAPLSNDEVAELAEFARSL